MRPTRRNSINFLSRKIFKIKYTILGVSIKLYKNKFRVIPPFFRDPPRVRPTKRRFNVDYKSSSSSNKAALHNFYYATPRECIKLIRIHGHVSRVRFRIKFVGRAVRSRYPRSGTSRWRRENLKKYPRMSNDAKFVEMWRPTGPGPPLCAEGFYFNASGRLVKPVKRENSFSKVFS